GAFFAFPSPILGWLGTAVTGSDTSANALFATLQQTAAHEAGLNPLLLVGANSSGGAVGKTISPQNLTIAATAVGLLGKEASIVRRVIWWSLGMLVVMCLLVGLQSTVLSWMVPSACRRPSPAHRPRPHTDPTSTQTPHPPRPIAIVRSDTPWSRGRSPSRPRSSI